METFKNQHNVIMVLDGSVHGSSVGLRLMQSAQITDCTGYSTIALTVTYTAHWYSDDYIVKTMTMGIYVSIGLDLLGCCAPNAYLVSNPWYQTRVVQCGGY